MEDAVLGLKGSLAPKDLKQLSWQPHSDSYVYLDETSQTFVRIAATDMKADTLISLASLNKALVGKDTLKSMPAIKWLSISSFYFSHKNHFYKSIYSSGVWYVNTWTKLPDNAENMMVSDDATQLAYNVENNLYVVDGADAVAPISNEPNKNIVYGQAVHRNEFGIDKGIFFSPKGNFVAFYRMDQTMVADYPVIDWSVTPAVNNNIKYPMAGGASHQVTLGIYNTVTKQTVYMQTGEPKDHYLTCVTWSPDEKYVFIAILNREQNHLWLNKYDALTGAFMKTLFEESDNKYVEPQNPLAFLPGSNSEFLWWSQRDGFMHLYRYDTTGKLLNQVTKGDWLVNELIGFNPKKEEVIFTANKETPLGKNVYKANWVKGVITRLDDSNGVHTIKMSDDGNYILDALQNQFTSRKIELYTSDKKINKNILTAPDPLADYQRPQIKNLTLNADDGTLLYGRIIYPVGFDSSKKYPVIVYLYNGPHVQLLQNSYPASANLWYEYLAQHGYIVFTMDGRGSGNRGLKFEQATFRHLGKVEMDDQLKGVDYLKSLPYVDADRMGVHGWSFGGFMTTSLMLRHPGIFKCAVAGGPVIDWSMYEVMYTERYMDTPQENPEGYEENNLLTKTKNLKGKLLMIHGTQDGTVVWQHSIKFVKACVDNGVQIDYFVYPGYEHNVIGKDRVHLMQKITDYFDEYLKK